MTPVGRGDQDARTTNEDVLWHVVEKGRRMWFGRALALR